jgi:hypothetical protein
LRPLRTGLHGASQTFTLADLSRLSANMNRLLSELHRLYLAQPPGPADAAAEPALIGPAGTVRAMVLEITQPAGWAQLSSVWRGVQVELALPAPAIAVSGTDGLQLWFSVAEPIAVAQAHAFLQGLRQRFLAEADPRRVRLMPDATASAQHPQRHARLVPALQAHTGNWSAFVAPDLAPVFDETPWLDIAPSEEGQAHLLGAIDVMAMDVFAHAMAALAHGQPPAATAAPAAPVQQPVIEAAAGRPSTAAPTPPALAAAGQEALDFLRQVMRDDAAPLGLRIEAAKALISPRGQA